jgi:VanZ like family
MSRMRSRTAILPQLRFTRINIARSIAWIGLTAIVILTLVPAGLRPVSALPHVYEHLAVFLLIGFAFGIGYPGQRLVIGIAALPTIGMLELLQLFVPGRHARLSDFAVNLVGALIGLIAAYGVGIAALRTRGLIACGNANGTSAARDQTRL